MSSNEETQWIPTEEDIKIMRLMLNIGMSYDEFYLTNYGKELQVMLDRVALALLRLDNKYPLCRRDNHNYLMLKDKLKNKLNEILSPRFNPGDLVNYVQGDDKCPCTIVGLPRIEGVSRKPVVDVLIDGQVRPVILAKVRPSSRRRRSCPPTPHSP